MPFNILQPKSLSPEHRLSELVASHLALPWVHIDLSLFRALVKEFLITFKMKFLRAL